MTTKHTPGPWKLKGNQVTKLITWDDGARFDFEVCSINNSTTHGNRNSQANARLIAAAPELLEACKTMQDILATLYKSRMLTVDDADKFCKAEKAILKAEGEA